MAFHTGLTLSQSAYTVLYSHPSALEAIQLNNYIEGVRSQGKEVSEDDRRPMELLCIVLRAAMIGMNKTLGLVWDELMRGNLYEVNPHVALTTQLSPIQTDRPSR
jgi:hypothetical protein